MSPIIAKRPNTSPITLSVVNLGGVGSTGVSVVSEAVVIGSSVSISGFESRMSSVPFPALPVAGVLEVVVGTGGSVRGTGRGAVELGRPSVALLVVGHSSISV